MCDFSSIGWKQTGPKTLEITVRQGLMNLHFTAFSMCITSEKAK